MAKQVLGDNPFGPAASKGGDEAPPVDGPPPVSAATAPPAATAKARRKPRRAARPQPGARSRGAQPPRHEPPAASTTEAPPSRRRHVRRAEDMLGAEAIPSFVPEPEPVSTTPDYGPSLDQRPHAPDRGGIGDEFRMLERWVRDRFQPLSERRQLPFSFLWKCWRRFAMRDRSEVVDEFGQDPVYSRKLEPLLDFLYRSYFRVDASGLENLPNVGRGLVVSNHSGTLPYDAMMLMYAARADHPRHRELRPLTEDFVFHFPYLGTMVNRLGGVRACPENAERLLRADQLVAVFPEGIKGIGKLYRERYQLQRFGRGGFVKLALRTDSPIIPAAVIGAEEIHPMLSRITWLAHNLGIPYVPITPTFPWLGPLGLVPLPTKWFICFGPPLYFNAEYGAAAADDRILVNRLAENVRSIIQEMVDATLARRKSILFG